MTCWAVLQLDEDADERSIKRSYARLLKVHRPDEDPEGFQRLREAYEHALSVARWRAERELESSDDTVVERLTRVDPLGAETRRDPLQPASDAAERIKPVEPALFEVPTAPASEVAARALLDGLSSENLGQRWQQAQAQACTEAFERHLLQLCFDHPALRSSVARWAAQHLEWLTPWQRVAMSEAQQTALASGLLQDYQQTLQYWLEDGQEREYINQLKAYSAQPWLQVFDRRQQWQSMVMQQLHDSQWSVPLFERVCQLFDWDDAKSVHPQPAWIWQALVERCQQESFYQNLQEKVDGNRTWAADVQAAHLLMTPMSPKQQKKMIDGFGLNEWQACQDLADNLKWRYPQLIERLPYRDVYFWRRFLPRPVLAETWIRVWAGVAVALALFYREHNQYSPGLSFLCGLFIAWIPIWFARLGMSWWEPITATFITQDLRLTERLIPRSVNPDSRWLLLRHGVPQLAMLALFTGLLGVLGFVSYFGFISIGLLHKRRMGRIDPDLAARHPWLTALHWAHWSPLQLGFLLMMVVVTVLCQSYWPGFPLTHMRPG